MRTLFDPVSPCVVEPFVDELPTCIQWPAQEAHDQGADRVTRQGRISQAIAYRKLSTALDEAERLFHRRESQRPAFDDQCVGQRPCIGELLAQGDRAIS